MLWQFSLGCYNSWNDSGDLEGWWMLAVRYNAVIMISSATVRDLNMTDGERQGERQHHTWWATLCRGGVFPPLYFVNSESKQTAGEIHSHRRLEVQAVYPSFLYKEAVVGRKSIQYASYFNLFCDAVTDGAVRGSLWHRAGERTPWTCNSHPQAHSDVAETGSTRSHRDE